MSQPPAFNKKDLAGLEAGYVKWLSAKGVPADKIVKQLKLRRHFVNKVVSGETFKDVCPMQPPEIRVADTTPCKYTEENTQWRQLQDLIDQHKPLYVCPACDGHMTKIEHDKAGKCTYCCIETHITEETDARL